MTYLGNVLEVKLIGLGLPNMGGDGKREVKDDSFPAGQTS